METHNLLKGFHLFRNADIDETRCERRHCAPREVVFREGDPADALYPNACIFLAKRLRRTLLDLSFAREVNGRHF